MRALLAFNIFKSLFGRESATLEGTSRECGSWVFPNVSDSSGTGFMAIGDLTCPYIIRANFIEAMVSASFLGVFWYLSKPRKPKLSVNKFDKSITEYYKTNREPPQNY